MTIPWGLLLILYWILISFLSVIVTVSDKRRAKKHRRRVPESALPWLAALGGGPAMYAAMRIIRHKTLHKKFMVGIPVIILLELLAAFLLCRFLL